MLGVVVRVKQTGFVVDDDVRLGRPRDCVVVKEQPVTASSLLQERRVLEEAVLVVQLPLLEVREGQRVEDVGCVDVLLDVPRELLVERPSGEVAAPVLAVLVRVGEEVATQHGEISVPPTRRQGRLLLSHQFKVFFERSEFDSYLPLFSIVHVIHQSSVVFVLLVPLHFVIVSEIVAQGHQYCVVLV